MGITESGISTTLTPGQEQAEKIRLRTGRRVAIRYQYDYRGLDGTLFTCVKRTVEAAREARDAWLAAKHEQACGKREDDCGQG